MTAAVARMIDAGIAEVLAWRLVGAPYRLRLHASRPTDRTHLFLRGLVEEPVFGPTVQTPHGVPL